MLAMRSSLGWLLGGQVVEMVCEKVNTTKTICENMYVVVELLSMLDSQ
jgi:hypothetical protein